MQITFTFDASRKSDVSVTNGDGTFLHGGEAILEGDQTPLIGDDKVLWGEPIPSVGEDNVLCRDECIECTPESQSLSTSGIFASSSVDFLAK